LGKKISIFFNLWLKRAIRSAVGTGPGNAVAGHSPGIFKKTTLANLKTTGTNPAELFALSAAMAFKSSSGPFAFSMFKGHPL
jgi:hypothetical protein